MWVSFRPAIRANNCDTGAEIFDKVPSGSSDCEQIHIVADIAENLKGSVMLEEQVHLDTESPDVLEHI